MRLLECQYFHSFPFGRHAFISKSWTEAVQELVEKALQARGISHGIGEHYKPDKKDALRPKATMTKNIFKAPRYQPTRSPAHLDSTSLSTPVSLPTWDGGIYYRLVLLSICSMNRLHPDRAHG